MSTHRETIRFLLFLILVTLMTGASATDSSAIRETFDAPDLPGWDHSSGARVADGILRIEPGNFAARPGALGDMELATRLRFRGEGEIVVSHHLVGMTGYHLAIGRDFLASRRETDGVQTELAASPMDAIPMDVWLLLEIQIIGGEQRILVNGKLVLAASDAEPLPPGRLAFETLGQTTLQIDELTLMHEGVSPSRQSEAVPGVATTREIPSGSEPGWVRTGGPPGGIGYDIRYKFDKSGTWFSTDNFAGVHISKDNGLTWLPSNKGIPGQLGPTGDWKPIFSLTADPHNPQIVWAGTDKTGHIYKSTDGGLSWTRKDSGVATMTDVYDALTFRGFTIDPNTSDIVYAMGEIANTPAGGAEVWGNAVGGLVYKTSDGGEHWKLLWDGGIPSSLTRYMWINPQNTDILYVSTGIFDRGAVNERDPDNDPDPYGGLGILKSVDGGKNWRVLNEANGLDFLYIGSLFMHPDDPDILLAAAGKYETDLYIDYLKKNNLKTKMGVYRTSDGGENWTQVLPAGGGFNSVEMCPSDPDIAYAGSGVHVYRSEDAGVTWKRVAGEGGDGWGPPGVLAGAPIDMQCDPDNPDRVFTNNYLGGNFLSEDGGKTWKNASDGYTGAQILSVSIDPKDPARIYAAGRTGIWGSSNGGNSWYGLRYPPRNQPVWGGEWGSIVVDPSNPEHLLASEETIWESFDGGSSWEIRRSPAYAQAATIVFAPSDPKTVYTGRAHSICLLNLEAPCGPGHGVYVSRDGGTTWDFANDPSMAKLTIIDLSVDPQDARTVYAATERGLFKTRDGGKAWRPMTGLPNNERVGAIAVHPLQSQHLMAGVENHGLYTSMDSGQTWKRVAAGLQPNSAIRDILFDPVNPQTVYLSDLSSGVYRSTDGGLGWRQMNNGLSTRSTTGLAIASDGQHLYVATSGEGVFRLDFTGQPPESSTPSRTRSAPASEPPG